MGRTESGWTQCRSISRCISIPSRKLRNGVKRTNGVKAILKTATAPAIERAIDEHYDGERLCFCANEVIEKYGFERVNFVLAATVRQGTHDGRYSEDNKNWARRFSVMDKENTWQYHVRSHPGLVNLFVADARRLWDRLGLFNSSHCENESGNRLDYTDRIVVLDPSILKDECKTPQDQLFMPNTETAADRFTRHKGFWFSCVGRRKGYYRRDRFHRRAQRGTHPRMGTGKYKISRTR